MSITLYSEQPHQPSTHQNTRLTVPWLILSTLQGAEEDRAAGQFLGGVSETVPEEEVQC